jgi:hypothetical protein
VIADCDAFATSPVLWRNITRVIALVTVAGLNKKQGRGTTYFKATNESNCNWPCQKESAASFLKQSDILF